MERLARDTQRPVPHREGIRITSKSDRIKEALGWVKVMFGLLVAIDVSVIAWISEKFSSADPILVVVAILLAVLISGVIFGINWMAYRRLKELEKL